MGELEKTKFRFDYSIPELINIAKINTRGANCSPGSGATGDPPLDGMCGTGTSATSCDTQGNSPVGVCAGGTSPS